MIGLSKLECWLLEVTKKMLLVSNAHLAKQTIVASFNKGMNEFSNNVQLNQAVTVSYSHLLLTKRLSTDNWRKNGFVCTRKI